MYYEINVSFRGQHFFATSERSITSQAQAHVTLLTFKQKFPKSEGYTITVYACQKTSRDVTNEI